MAVGMKRELPSLILLLVVCALLLGVIAAGIAALGNAPAAVNTSGGGEGSSGGFFSRLFPTAGMKNAAPPESVVVDYMRNLDTAPDGEKLTISTDGARLYLDCGPDGEEGRLLYNLLQNAWSFQIDPAVIQDTTATVKVYITCPDTSLFASPLRQMVTETLTRKVESAQHSEEIYDENQQFREDLLKDAFWSALGAVSGEAREKYSVTVATVIRLDFYEKQWHVTNTADVTNTLDLRTQQLREFAVQDQPYQSLHYSIEETATVAPVPNPAGFGTTEDPAVVSALLETVWAKNLIRGQTLCWSPEIEFLPGKPIRTYLDESILMIEWQEEECGMVGTFSEVFISDPSQIRRKIAGDAYEYQHFFLATQLAQQCNAVLATGGDLYHHGRNCGIVVYDRTIYRFDQSVDTCYITTSGDMLFSYRNQFSSQEEAQRFVEENDILYSLCFGPVMIDNGEDVTPGSYPYGEIWDTYARAAFGLLGERHYLNMNLNCGTGVLYNYANLRQAADVMVQRGCIKAYTLDGGQTCCTIVNGELVSPVQFGNERYTSDILYYATAIPNE